MTNDPAPIAFESLLTHAVDRLVAAVGACVTAARSGGDIAAPLEELSGATSNFVEQLTSRAASQAAGATLLLHRETEKRLDTHTTRLNALDAGQQLHEERIAALERDGKSDDAVAD